MTRAQQIADDVCSKQSLEAGSISGAALTSDTVLIAVENALKPKEK